ncbi:MAG TPA: S41 family peptidase, partial [Candidatus Polarisedimenticolaceae bacterium]|nr:S41 family peptidase [Candidatus Polarisedimenticolaceae bacterium]
MKKKLRALLVTSVGMTACLGASPSDAERAAWLEEFTALRAAMARNYANLDWMVAHRHLDLLALREATEMDLRQARSARQARRAIEQFVASFHDSHLRVVESQPPSGDGGGGPPREGKSCSDLGFEKENRGFRFPFEKAKGWERAGGSWFPAGSFGSVGVIRIAAFGEDKYREACEEVGPAQVRARLTTELRTTIRQLKERSISMMVVDLTGNGGGTEWVAEVVRLFASGTLRRPQARRPASNCDRMPIWDGKPVCPGLADAGEATMEGEGEWSGPLAVLVDDGTASASEDFVVWLRGRENVTIVGERTYGAGCGYVQGGAPARLQNLGVTVRMPNCARFTWDGINEIEGIAPDVPLALDEGDAATRIGKLAG